MSLLDFMHACTRDEVRLTEYSLGHSADEKPLKHNAGCQHSAVAGDFSRGPVTEHSSSHQCLIANAFLAWDLQKHLWQISLNSVETWCYIVLLGTFSAVALSRKR